MLPPLTASVFNSEPPQDKAGMRSALQEKTPGSELVTFRDAGSHMAISVRLEDDTIWLTQKQMAEVFDTTNANVSIHLKNIYEDGELQEPATVKEISTVRIEGSRQVTRTLPHYNLDAIISVGYRVNSKQGVKFRQWATKTLNDHLTKGFTLNAERLASAERMDTLATARRRMSMH